MSSALDTDGKFHFGFSESFRCSDGADVVPSGCSKHTNPEVNRRQRRRVSLVSGASDFLGKSLLDLFVGLDLVTGLNFLRGSRRGSRRSRKDDLHGSPWTAAICLFFVQTSRFRFPQLSVRSFVTTKQSW